MEEHRTKWNELYELCIKYCNDGKIENALQEICNAVKFYSCNQHNVHSMARLLRIVREALYPHSTSRSFCIQWDRYAAYVLVHCVFPGSLMESWERVIREMLSDLNKLPYDGSDGIVKTTMQHMRRLYDVVVDNDHISLRSIVLRRKLQFPVVHILDECGWSLLHHAAYHSAVECMEFLIMEGISVNAVSFGGQTPVHVAAAALRYDAVCVLSRMVSPGTKIMRDDKDMTPLVSLLDSLRSCNWTRRMSSQQLLKCIQALVLSDMDYWNVSPTANHMMLDGHISVFSACVAYTDNFVASKIIHLAYSVFQKLVDELRDRGDVDGQCAARTSLVGDILYDVKKTILFVIRRKKSRVLSLLVDTFLSFLTPNTHTDNMHFSCSYHVDNGMGLSRLDMRRDDSSLTSLGYLHVALFWQQCLFLSSMTGSLRLTSVILPHCIQGLVWMSQQERGGSARMVLREPFLLVPVCRGDSTMLRSILDGFQQHPHIPLWISTPLISNTATMSSENCAASTMTVDEFVSWCRQSIAVRRKSDLLRVAYHIFSPIAAACLMGNSYILHTILRYHWSPQNLLDTTNAAGSMLGIFGGVNPLLCCVLSGSRQCVDVLLEHLGGDVFTWMCNDKGPFKVIPLRALLWILRVRLTKRLYRHPDIVQDNIQNDIALYETLYSSYCSVELNHEDMCHMVKVILPRTELCKVGRDYKERACTGSDGAWNLVTLEEFRQYRCDIQCSMSQLPVAISDDNRDVKIAFRNISLWWRSMSVKVYSSSFMISLKILMQIVLGSSNDVFSTGSSVRTNRHLVSLCRAVVILLEWKQDDGYLERIVNRDWWKRLSSFTGGDFGLNTSKSFRELHDRDVSHGRKCRLGAELLSLRGTDISGTVTDDIRSIFPNIGDHKPDSPSFFTQLKAELPTRQSNRYNTLTIGFAVDVIYEWLALVMAENTLVAGVGRSVLTRFEKEDEMEAVDHVISRLGECGKHDTSIMWLVGEDLFPVEMDMIVCTASAFVSENVYRGIVPVSSVKPCRYNGWSVAPSEGADNSLDESEESILSSSEQGGVSEVTELPLLSDSWKGRTSRGDYVTHAVNIIALCDDMAKLLIDDGRESFDTIDAFGMTPLISMCSHGLSTAAEYLLPSLHDSIVGDITHSNSKTAVSETAVLFPGGLLIYDYLLGGHGGIRNNRNIGAAIWKRLHWNVDQFRNGEVSLVSASGLAVCRRADEFLKKYISYTPPADMQSLLTLLLIYDNPELCIDIGHICMGEDACTDLTNVTMASSKYLTAFNHRLSNIIDGMCIYDVSDKKRFSGFALHRGDGIKCPTDWLVCARLFIKIVAKNNVTENSELYALGNFAETKDDGMSDMQKSQQKAMIHHGFYPQYGGPLAGLSLARGDRVWMLNGSLISFDEFFSDVKNLHHCLPVPHTSPRYGFSTGYSALHALASTASRLPRNVVRRLAERLVTKSSKDCSSTASILKSDARGRTAVYLALKMGNVELATQLMAMMEGKSTSVDYNQRGSTYIPPEINGGRIGSLYMRYAADNILRLESKLKDILQGSIVQGRNGSLLYLLSMNLDRVEMLWNHLILKCNIGALAKMMYDPAGQIVDCFQKAKSVLLMLNIPFSQISEKNSHYNVCDANAPSLCPDSCIDINKENQENSALYFASCRDITPEKLKQKLSWKTAVDIKHSLTEWVVHHLRAHVDSKHSSGSMSRPRQPSLCDVVRRDGSYGGAYGGVSESYVHDAVRAELEASVLLYKATDISLVTFGTDKGHISEEGVRRTCSGRDSTIWGSSVPPLLLAETRRHRGKGVDSVHNMARLLTTFRNNTDLINDALKCAMAVLEFARSLCNARVLVSLTHEPFPAYPADDAVPSRNLPTLGTKSFCGSSKSVRFDDYSAVEQHPIDVLRTNVKNAKKYSTDLFNMLSPYGATTESIDVEISRQYMAVGAGARLIRDGDLPQASFAECLSIDSEVSPTFSMLRSVIMAALLILVDIKGLQKNKEDNEIRLVAQLMHRYMQHNCYDENRVLTGEPSACSSEKENVDYPPLTDTEFQTMIVAVTSLLHSFRACDLAFTSMTISRRNRQHKTQSPMISLMDTFCRHVKEHASIFNQYPVIPVQKSHLSIRAPNDSSVSLDDCPCAYERRDLLKLVAYTAKHSRAAAAATSSLVDTHMKRLRRGYEVANTLIGFVLRVMGVFAMAHVYKSDYLNWRGIADCSPYMAMCSVHPPSPGRGSELYRLQEDRKLEDQLIECMAHLRNCEVDNIYDISSPVPSVLAASPVFSTYSPADFFIAITALQGRSRLLNIALSTLISTSTSRQGIVDRINLIWLVALTSPPPPVSPVYIQYSTVSTFDSENCSDRVHTDNCYHSAYEECIILLLTHGFFPTAPDGASLSVLDLVSLKGMARAVCYLLSMEGVDHNLRPCSSLSAVHFILLSDRMNLETLDIMLKQCGGGSTASAIVDFASFLSDVNRSVQLICSTMSIISSMALQQSLSSPVSSDDEMSLGNIILSWTPHRCVCTAFRALKGLVARRPKVASPLHLLFTNYLNEVMELDEFDPTYTFRDYHQNDLVWTTLHVAMACKSGPKFRCLWTRFTEVGMSSTSSEMSPSATSADAPLDLLHYACFFHMPDALSCLQGDSSYGDVNVAIFFPPLNSSYTPVDVALRVGSQECMAQLIRYEMRSSVSYPQLTCTLLMTCISSGYGGERMAMTIFLTLIELDQYNDSEGPLSTISKRLLNTLSSPVENRSRYGVLGRDTVLHACARRNYSNVCERLLALGVHSSLLDSEGMRPIQVSIALGHAETTRAFGQYCRRESRAACLIAFVCRRGLFLRFYKRVSS